MAPSVPSSAVFPPVSAIPYSIIHRLHKRHDGHGPLSPAPTSATDGSGIGHLRGVMKANCELVVPDILLGANPGCRAGSEGSDWSCVAKRLGRGGGAPEPC